MIEVDGLTMDYGATRALDHVSFRVAEGEVIGLLGPNGAGKSTTMKILTTYLWPSAGRALLGGHDVTRAPLAVRALVGYLPEAAPLYLEMEVGAYLRFCGGARGLRGRSLRARVDWVVDRCGLRPMLRRPIRALSKGYKQRTGLAQALIHDPAVIILDEPTSGLDPHQILEVRALVADLAASKTVILSTHVLSEAEAMADRILIIDRGRLVAEGTLEALRAKVGARARVVVGLDSGGEDAALHLQTVPVVESVGSAPVSIGPVRGRAYLLEGLSEAVLVGAVTDSARARGWTVTHLATQPHTLEETFLALTHTDASTANGPDASGTVETPAPPAPRASTEAES